MKRNSAIVSLASALLLLSPACVWAGKTINHLRTCYMQNPLGLEERPDFSWRMEDDRKKYSAWQTAYQVVVADSKENLEKGVFVYDTHKQTSDVSACIPYKGVALKPSTRYYWKVTVWDEKGKSIESDEEAWFETALMDTGWSGAQWIGSQHKPLSPYIGMGELNLDFQIEKGSQQATFVFGCIDPQNYVLVEINVKDSKQPFFRLVQTVDGKQTEVRRQDISDIIAKDACNNSHHLTVRMLAENYYRSYNLDFSIDGKDLKAAKNAPEKDNRFVITPKPDDLSYIYCRLYGIGFKQDQGQNAKYWNLTMDEQFHKSRLYSSDRAYDVRGNGQLQVWSPGEEHSAPMLRKTFNVSKPVKAARLYATARGIYEMEMNGKPISDDFFNPGWTDYRFRQNYNTFDVTPLVRQGKNAIGSVLGTGWYTGTAAHTPMWSNQYGTEISFLAKLVITYTDGTSETIVSDPTWKYYDQGPVVNEGWLDGEDYDARKEVAGWSMPGFDDSQWNAVKVYDAPADKVVMHAYIGQTIREDEVCTAKKMTQPLPGHYIYDMGQNMVGVPRITVKGKKGQEITFRFCEMLYPEVIPTEPVAPYTIDIYKEKHGQIYTDNYRSALSTDHYICKGDAQGETFEPHFTSHGFRYIQITGTDGPLALEDVKVVVLNSLGKEQTCSYETSDPLINTLYSNIVWGQKSNFLSVPTDCPQRDERLGWSGDAQIFTRTATYNRNVSPFFTRWLYTVRDDQGDDGNYSHFNPSIGDIPAGGGLGGTAFGWAEVGIVTPWQIYQQYGNRAILEESYASMKRYMDYVEKHADNFIQPLGGYGDWVALRGTISDLTNTCYSAYDAQIMQQVAKVLGHEGDSRHYGELFRNIKQAFAKRYVREDGRLIKPAGSPSGTDSYAAAFGGGEPTDKDQFIDTQTGYIIPLYMNMLDGETKTQAVNHLVELLKDNNYCLNTGFIGTPYLNIVLSDNGRDDVAYRMFQQTAYPSWIYPILQGATTIWERWNSYTLKNGFGPVEMNSFNHYSYGAIQDWMMAYSAGIQRDEQKPGYKHFVLQPRIGGRLDHVAASFESVYGNITSRWESDNKMLTATTDAGNYGYTYTATVPANTTATLILPVKAGMKLTVKEGKKGMSAQQNTEGSFQCELAPGNYTFIVR